MDAEVTMANVLLDSETVGLQADDEEAEEQLIERARQSSQALGKLYRIYEPRISAYVVRRIGNVQESEDIVANVFLAMVRHLPKYRPTKAPFGAWLYRIATNEINWFLRKRRLRGLFVPIGRRRRRPSSVQSRRSVRTCQRSSSRNLFRRDC